MCLIYTCANTPQATMMSHKQHFLQKKSLWLTEVLAVVYALSYNFGVLTWLGVERKGRVQSMKVITGQAIYYFYCFNSSFKTNPHI